MGPPADLDAKQLVADMIDHTQKEIEHLQQMLQDMK